MPHRRRTHRMVIKKDDLDVADTSQRAMVGDSDEGCNSNFEGCSANDDADEDMSTVTNKLLGSISRLLSANNQAEKCLRSDGKRSTDNGSETDEFSSIFENIFNQDLGNYYGASMGLDGPNAKKARCDFGHIRDDWPVKESGSSMTIPMPMCIRLVELYRRSRALLRSLGQKKEDRRARHDMWEFIDRNLTTEFGIHSGINRLKKKIQNIQAGARGKIEALRRETNNGTVAQDTNIRFTPAEMEMVRMLYQNGDKVLNTISENNEPFYLQLEALMRRESSEKKSQQLHESGSAERTSTCLPNAKSVIYPHMLINQATAQAVSRKHALNVTKESPGQSAVFSNANCEHSSMVSLFSKPFHSVPPATHLSKTDPIPSSNGVSEQAVMSELIAKQLAILKRQEELQRRSEVLYEQQLARDTKVAEDIASLNKVAFHLQQISEIVYNVSLYIRNVNNGTISPNNHQSE